MTEAELTGDLHGTLDKVWQGVEIVVERDPVPVAVIRSPLPKGRLHRASGSARLLGDVDDGFMKDHDPIAARAVAMSGWTGVGKADRIAASALTAARAPHSNTPIPRFR
jgi:hypothetical protein